MAARDPFAPAWLSKGYTQQDLDRVSRDMAAQLRADSLRYLPVAEVAPSIGLAHDHLCSACVTGDYPSAAGTRIYEGERENGRDRSDGHPYDNVAQQS